jgi:ribonuclease BN (tRNA processing enzyme)
MRLCKREGVKIIILGGSGPFSTFGDSIAYRVSYKGVSYLIDCGAPVFEFFNPCELRELRGLVGTHSHEDHKRWFSDLALYKRYHCGTRQKLQFITSEVIHEEYMKNSRGALERTLSNDSRRVIEIPYDEFVDQIIIGPASRYKIMFHHEDDGSFHWRVMDAEGRIVPPTKAKIVINHRVRANRPRMLYKDDESGEWVEPDSYYPFSALNFYEANQNTYVDPETGLNIRPIKSTAWHGPPTISIEVTTDRERIVFSSDTVYDPELWRQLCEEKHPQRLGMSKEKFEAATVIYGNINNFIERTWSPARFGEAMNAYKGAVVVHDVATSQSVVHTDYEKIVQSDATSLILTHAPDRFVSQKPLAMSGKAFVVRGKRVVEEVNGREWPINADVYYRNMGELFVGYKHPRGDYLVLSKNGVLDIVHAKEADREALRDRSLVMRVKLYRDLGGRYLQMLRSPSERYVWRPDGKIELVRYNKHGSTAKMARDIRPRLVPKHIPCLETRRYLRPQR